MAAHKPDPGEIAAFVHTHGTRLTRLAHLLGADPPDVAAADAMASTLLRRTRGGDAHEDLLAAARIVGSRGVPQVHDDARLHGWLDRAELVPHPVDLTTLVGSTGVRLQTQLAARRRGRLRAAAGAAAAALLVAGGLSWPDDDEPSAAGWQVKGSGILFPNNPYLNGGDPNAVVPDLPGVGWVNPPPRQRIARDIALAGVVLTGRTTTIMHASLLDGPATVLAVACTTEGGLPAICVLLAPTGVSLPDLETEAVIALLPSPQGGRVLNQLLPTVLRGSMIGTLSSQTLLLDVTSSDVDAALVTYNDGSRVLADRYLPLGSGHPLFVARNKDVMPASVAYIDKDGHTLAHRSLYTATS